MVIIYSKDKDLPGKVAKSCSWSLSRPSPFTPENLVSRDGFDGPVPRHAAYLHNNQAESGATYEIPPEFRGGVHILKEKSERT